MPDHVHAVVRLPQTGRLSAFMHEWKRQSSLQVRSWLREEAPKHFEDVGEGDKFWQPRYYAIEIYEQAKLEEKLDDMRLNPVRAGLAEKATDWKWSSARWYLERRSVGVPIQWVP